MFEPDHDAGRALPVVAWHVRAMLAMLGFLVLALVAASTTDDGVTRGVVALIAASAAVTGCLGLAGRRLSAHGSASLLAWPCLSLTTVTAYAQVDHEAASLLLGIFVLTFLFIGVTQPLRRCWWPIAPAAVAMWTVLDLDARQAVIRVTLAALVWTLVACWPAYLLDQLRGQRREIAASAATDPLTGVQNRTHLQAHLDHVDKHSTLVLIDLDRFKLYNDEHGHIGGDILLRDFADILVAQTRAGDAVYRFGGEEFLVVLHRTPVTAGREFADRLAVEWSAHASGTTFSAGIAAADESGLLRADASLYEAKRAGRGRAIVSTGLGTVVER